MPHARRTRRRSEGQQERLEARPVHGRGDQDAAHDRRFDETARELVEAIF
jgi:hypothetical protein